MFIVNQQLLSEKNNKQLWDWYQAKLKEIRAEGREYYQYNTLRKPLLITTDKGLIKSRKYKVYPISKTIFNEDFQEYQTWVHAPSINSIVTENGASKVRNSKGFMFNNETILSVKNDIEIIFFLRYISDYLQKGVLFFIDKDKDNKDRAEQDMLKYEVGSLIYSPASQIAPEKLESEDTFRSICVAWTLTEVDKKPIHQLRNELMDMVTNLHENIAISKRGYKDFIKDCNDLGDSDLKASINLAIEREYLYYDPDAISWKLKVKGGNEQFIETMEQSNISKATDILMKKFSKNATLKNLLETVIKSGGLSPVVLSDNRFELMSELKEFGYEHNELKKMKTDEMVAKLKEEIDKKNFAKLAAGSTEQTK